MAGRRGARAAPLSGRGAAAAAGDQAGWDALVERYCQQVWDTARGHGLDAAEAAEVCQLAWLRLADHLPAVAAVDDIGSWLCEVAGCEARRVADRSAAVAVTGVAEVHHLRG